MYQCLIKDRLIGLYFHSNVVRLNGGLIMALNRLEAVITV